MKKLLLSILTLVSVAAFAQKDLDITLLSPADSAEINSGKAISVAFYVKNTGSTPILATDTFRVNLFLALSSTSITPLGAFSIGKSLNAGDSAIYAPTNPIGVTFANDVNNALFIITVGFKDTIANVDPNDSNDVDLSIVNLRVIKTSVAELNNLASSVSAFPNPANTEFTITMKSTDATVEVMDVTGKLINTYPIVLGEAKMDVSNFNNGVYFYQIKTSANETVKSGKFTVSH